MPSTIDLGTLSAGDFEARLNDAFRLPMPTGEVALKLAEVSRLGASKRPGGAFSLAFLAPAGPVLPQAIYPVVHPALGTLEIFLVPLGPGNGGMRYEAVFT